MKKNKISSFELNFLFKILRINGNNCNRLIREEFAKVNFNKLIFLGEDHHVSLWLYHKISEISKEVIPEKVFSSYAYFIKRSQLKQLKQVQEFFRIKEALDNSLIQFIPFKGFQLAHTYYGDISLREFRDLDLLVRSSDLKSIIHLMTGLGYQSTNRQFTNDHEYKKLINNSPEYNMDVWSGGSRLSHVEFHWKISGRPLTIPCYLDEMQEFILVREFQGKSYSCFTPGGDLIMASFHHGGKEVWTSLGNILDIGMILKKFPEADYLPAIEWAEKRRISGIVLTGILLANQICKVEIPKVIEVKVKQKRIRALAKNRLNAIRFKSLNYSRRPLKYRPINYHMLSRDNIYARLNLLKDYGLHFFEKIVN